MLFYTTYDAEKKLLGWLQEGPGQIIPKIQKPNLSGWMLGLKELGEGISTPTIVFINIGGTDLSKEGDLVEEMVSLCSKEMVVVLASIDMRVQHDPVLLQAFCGQVSPQIVQAKIPGFREAVA